MLEPLYGLYEFAIALEISHSTVGSWHRNNKLPTPYQTLACGPIWLESQVNEFKELLNEKMLPQRGRKIKKVQNLLRDHEPKKYIFSNQERRDSMPVFITAANNKGGVGKSSTVANLSAILSTEYGLKVLCIDLDQQANLTKGLGIVFNIDEVPHIPHLLMEQAKLTDVVIETNVQNLYLIPSSIHLGNIENELIGQMFRERKLYNALTKPYINEFDAVLIDTPPNLGIFLINALTVTDYVIVPVSPEPWPLAGIPNLISMIEALKKDLKNMNLNKLRDWMLLITRTDFRIGMHQNLFNLINENYPNKVFKTCIKSNSKIADAQGHGSPISEFAKSAQGYKDYKQLADEVIELFLNGERNE